MEFHVTFLIMCSIRPVILLLYKNLERPLKCIVLGKQGNDMQLENTKMISHTQCHQFLQGGKHNCIPVFKYHMQL